MTNARPLASWVIALLALAACVQLARVSVFMSDPSAKGWVAIPSAWFGFYARHSCYEPYVVAGAMARERVANLYDLSPLEEEHCMPASWVGARFAASLRCENDTFGGLDVEPYEYPPPFLLLPRAALVLSDDFFTLRTAWYVIELTTFVTALVMAARFLRDRASKTALALVPAILLSLPVLLTLQIGNFQIAAFAWAILAMIAIERGAHAAGGALLAFVTLSKIYPGILLVPLAMRGRWRALAWTAAFGAGLLLATLLWMGKAPFEAFFSYQLPRLQSGDAFPWLETHASADAALRFAGINFSPYGLVKKLEVLGVPGMSRGVANGVLWAYGILVLAAASLAAWRTRAEADRGALLCTWLALLSLASLRSPFAPNVYAGIGTLWLLSIVLARASTARRRVLAALGMIALSFVASEGRGDFPVPWLGFAIDALQQVIVLVANGWVVAEAIRAPARNRPPLRA